MLPSHLQDWNCSIPNFFCVPALFSTVPSGFFVLQPAKVPPASNLIYHNGNGDHEDDNWFKIIIELNKRVNVVGRLTA